MIFFLQPNGLLDSKQVKLKDDFISAWNHLSIITISIYLLISCVISHMAVPYRWNTCLVWTCFHCFGIFYRFYDEGILQILWCFFSKCLSSICYTFTYLNFCPQELLMSVIYRKETQGKQRKKYKCLNLIKFKLSFLLKFIECLKLYKVI